MLVFYNENETDMDLQQLIQGDALRGLMDKLGVSGAQSESVAQEAVKAVKSKYAQNPKQLSSLVSTNPNTDDDNKLAAELEDDFVERLVKKVGLPESVAAQAKGHFPEVLGSITKQLSSSGKNSESGLAGIFGTVTDMLGNSGKKAGGLKALFKKFF